MTTLLVAKNDKTSLELLRFVARLIQDGDSAIEHKISQVVKGKDKTKMPAIIKPNGDVLTDINQIYLFLAQKPSEMRDVRSSRGNRDPSDFSDYNPYMFNYDDMIDREIDVDEDGRPVRDEKYEDQKVSRRRRDRGDDESEEDEEMPKNVSELSERFFQKRANSKSTIHSRRPAREERGRRPVERESGRGHERERPKQQSKKKYESSEDSEYESEEEDLESYMQGVIHSRDD